MWLYQDEEFTKEHAQEAIDAGFVGFVYEITNTLNGKKYIGKKMLVSVRRKPPLKGKKRKRIVRTQSDWQKYYGSSNTVKEILNESGKDIFKREILILCKSKGMLSYQEAKIQFDRNVLFDDTYYNEFIGCKIHASHFKGEKYAGNEGTKDND